MQFFPPSNLPGSIVLLITDELAAPADFVLHGTLLSHLKRPGQRPGGAGSNKTRAVVLSVSEGIGRWKALAAKANVNLQNHIDGGSLVFIDVLAEVQPPCGRMNSDENGLRTLFNRLEDHLPFSEPTPSPKLLILDDICTLEWVGFSQTEVLRFIRALRTLSLKTNTTFLIRHHLLSPAEADPDELFRVLLQISSYHLEVKPLVSGRSGSVSGEICLHRGFSASSDDVKLIPRNAALQYRLGDAGPEFFAKGTSEGVL